MKPSVRWRVRFKPLPVKNTGRLLGLMGLALGLVIAVIILWPMYWETRHPIRSNVFDGARALEDLHYQVSLGPRVPGSAAHRHTIAWLKQQLTRAGWAVEVQQSSFQMNDSTARHPVQNVVARWGRGEPWLILGAHYDSRLVADQDPNPSNRSTPVPGANDGASGVAVLLELARSLPTRLANSSSSGARQVWLVFFDVEDNGRLPGWDWLLGSKAFVSQLTNRPAAAVVVDMIGDANLQIYQEGNSDPALSQSIWAVAARLGFRDQFIPQVKHTILDDHVPFLQAGIPAVDIIDFEYPYWHTTADTSDKVSAQSLQVVGDTLLTWLTEYNR
jgi:glutaminyl-peptide cyclotransferase